MGTLMRSYKHKVAVITPGFSNYKWYSWFPVWTFHLWFVRAIGVHWNSLHIQTINFLWTETECSNTREINCTRSLVRQCLYLLTKYVGVQVLGSFWKIWRNYVYSGTSLSGIYSGHNTNNLSIKDTFHGMKHTLCHSANAFWTSQQWKPLY